MMADSPATFDTLLSQTYRLYQAADYVQALDLITREGRAFPERAQTWYYWRVCLATRAGQAALALQLFDEALAAGLWFSVTLLRQDSDLQPLQGMPEFEQRLEVCRQRQAAAQAAAWPLLIVLQPGGRLSPGAGYPLLLALHGNNQNAHATLDSWRPALAEGWLVASLQSSQVGGTDAYVWNDRDWAVREIQAGYSALCQTYPVDLERVVVAGFSLGAETAIWLALTATIKARGFIAVGPGGPFTNQPELWAPLIQAGSGLGLRGLVTIGEQDTFSYTGTQALVASLKEGNISCTVRVYPDLGHAFPPDFPQVLAEALASIVRI
jgi:pimeloyl-ACP methyl ester carboxylesterase